MGDLSCRRDPRVVLTDIYISIMLLVFPLFTGFSGYANVTFSKFVFFVAATGLWLAALVLLWAAKKLPAPRFGKRLLPAVIFGGVCLISWVLSPYKAESLIGAGRYDGLVTQLLYVCIFLGVSLFGRLRKQHFLCLGLGLLLCSAVGIVQFFGVDIFGLFPGDYSHYDSGLRYSGAFLGTMGNTNVLSSYYCLAIPILFCLPVLYGGWTWLALIPLCPALFVLIRAGVSGGFVGLGCAALLCAPLLLTDKDRISRTLLALCPLAVSAGLALAFAPEYSVGEPLIIAWSFGKGFALCFAGAALLLAAGLLARKLPSVSAKTLHRAIALLCLLALLGGLVFVWFSPAEEGTVYELSQVLRGNIDEKFGSSRILIWRECLKRFPARPLFGSGPDTVALVVDVDFSRYVEETGQTLQSSVDNAHNEYIGYLINTGLGGLIAHLALLLAGLWAWLRSLSSSKSARALGPGIICWCVQSFFALGLPIVCPMFWVILALAAGETEEN